MTALPTIYITLYDRLILNDLGGSCYGIASQRHITSYTEPSAGVRQWHRRKDLCVYIIHNWKYLLTTEYYDKEKKSNNLHDSNHDYVILAPG